MSVPRACRQRSAAARGRASAVALLLTAALSGCAGAADVAGSEPPTTTAGQASTADGSTSPPTATSRPPTASPTPQTTAGGGSASPPRAPAAHGLAAAESRPAEDPYYPDTSNPEVDALHYQLALDWDGHTLTGTTTLVFRAAASTDRIRLDLSHALTADTVSLDGERIGHTQAGDGLDLPTGRLVRDSQHTLEISYSGVPKATPAPSRRSDMTEGNGWSIDSDGSVFTFQEPYGAYTWYPVNDHPSDKAYYDTVITTHDGDVGVFNGQLLSSEESGGVTTTTWHLDQPAASYLTTLAIGPYTESTVASPAGMPISYWLLPQDQARLADVSEATGTAFDWLVGQLGPYPFSTLGVVVVGGASAMETQTMITVSRGAVDRPDAVMGHELAHQWFGDTVSPRTWQAVWLNEGWAMYMQQAYERATGEYEYAGGMSRWLPFDRRSRRVSGPPGDYDPRSFADINVYLGPAMMLDEIRQRLGNRVFAQVRRDWPATHRNESVDREEFTRWLNRKTGRNFRPLLHRWLDSPVTPKWTP